MPVKQIPISEIHPSPVRLEQLQAPLIARIHDVQLALNDVFPKPIEKWLDEFKRDTDPESEVEWWENLVVCYRAYTESKELTAAQKKLALKILLMLGMGEDIRALAADFGCLPKGAKDEISAMLGPSPN